MNLNSPPRKEICNYPLCYSDSKEDLGRQMGLNNVSTAFEQHFIDNKCRIPLLVSNQIFYSKFALYFVILTPISDEHCHDFALFILSAQVYCSVVMRTVQSLKKKRRKKKKRVSVYKYCQLIRFYRFTESGGIEDVSLSSYSIGEGKVFLFPFFFIRQLVWLC